MIPKSASSLRLTHCLLFLILVVAGLLLFYDAYAVYPHSTRMKVSIDVQQLRQIRTLRYTTNDGTIDNSIQTGTCEIANFKVAEAISPSLYSADVGAARPRSVVFGRSRGTPIWHGRILLLAERDDGSVDLYLVEGLPRATSITVEKHHLVRDGIRM